MTFVDTDRPDDISVILERLENLDRGWKSGDLQHPPVGVDVDLVGPGDLVRLTLDVSRSR